MSKKYSINDVKNYFEKYGYIVIDNEYINNQQKLNVICPNGHKWKVSFFDFKIRKVRCPFCRGNFNNKELKLKEIKEKISGKFEIVEFKNTSNLYLKCLKCGEIFKVVWKRFRKKLLCPFCNGNKKTLKIIKEYCKKFGYEILSSSYYYHKKLKFKCPNGHIFEMKWNDFQQGHRCPICIKKYNYSFIDIKNMVENDNLGKFKLISNEKETKNTYFKVKCLKCNYEFETNIYKWLNGHRCFKCWDEQKITKIEKEICNILEKNNIRYILHDRKTIHPKEIDIYLPDYKLGIEICGLYWHSFQMKNDKYYHFNKWKMCYNKGITLFHIFEDEWYNYKDFWLSKILMKCNKIDNFKKFRAEELQIRKINDKNFVKDFLEKYHIQGLINSFLFSLGLFDNKNECYGLIVISKYRFSKNKKNNNSIFEVARLCFKPYTIIYGGSEKLIKYAIKLLKKISDNISLITFIDLRYFSGNNIYNNIYTKIGFKLDKITNPNYYYFNPENKLTKFHRFTLKKRKNEDNNLTEFELRRNQGYYWIYDCGNLKYRLNL